jgi:hypothetical protein
MDVPAALWLWRGYHTGENSIRWAGAVAAMVFTLPRLRPHRHEQAVLYNSLPTRVAACSAKLSGNV